MWVLTNICKLENTCLQYCAICYAQGLTCEKDILSTKLHSTLTLGGWLLGGVAVQLYNCILPVECFNIVYLTITLQGLGLRMLYETSVDFDRTFHALRG